jgi:adenylylsulfate kinase
MSTPSDIHPIFDRLILRSDREQRLRQRGYVVWLYGLSGSGKSTLAVGLEKRLFEDGKFPVVLDGDNIRSGLNRNLGFSDEDRLENTRRVAEVAKILAKNGVVSIVSLICPARAMRELAREVIGSEQFLEVFVDSSIQTCTARDVKGLYAKVSAGEIKNFTGKDSLFERPEKPDVHLRTDVEGPEVTLNTLYQLVVERITIS